MPGCCETGRNVQKYRGGGGGGTASTLQEALENSNVATIDINLISGAKFRGDGSGLSNVPINGGNLNLQQVTNQDNQTTNEIIITNTGTSLTTSGAINASGNITAPSFIGSGSSLTSLNVTNASSGILQVARGGTGVTTGLTSLDGSNITSGTVALVRGGTGATSASTAASNLGLGTSDSPQFTGVNIGHASDTTITRSSAGVIAVEGKIVRTDDVALGTETSGNYVATITGGDGIASTGATTGETIDHSLSVDTKTNGGLAIESGKLALKLDDSSITGVLNASDGGTGVTTGLSQLNAGNITSGTVPTIYGGTGVTTGLSVLNATNLTSGTVNTARGGTGVTTGLSVLNATNLTSGTVATARGGTGVTTGLSVLNPSNLSGPVDISKGGTGVTTGLDVLNATNLTSGTVATARGGTGVTTGLSVLNATNLTSGTVNTTRGGTGVTTGLGVLNATNLTSGTVATTRGGTGVTTGLSVLDPGNLSGPVSILKGGTGVTTGITVLDPGNLSGTVSISKGGTGATTASAAATALGIGPGSTPQFTSIELGHASDTTIARSGAGKVTIEGNEIRTGTVESDKGGTGQTSYNVGEILVANDPNNTGAPTLHKLPAGSSGYFLKSEGAGSPLVWSNVAAVGSSTPGQLFTGVGLTGANKISDGNTPPTFSGGHTGAGDTTISVDSATGNVASKLVMRDTSGEIRVEEVIVGTGTTGTLTSTTWSGSAATAGSAATLTTPRDIGGQSFDGSDDITLPGVDAVGNQDTTGNAATATKLAAAVNIGGVSFDGSAAISLPGVNVAGTVNTSGNAATATKLASSVNIGGVSFDGSAAIQLPGVDIAGTVNTSGNAATATKLASSVNIGGVSFDGSAAIQLPGVDIAGTVNTSGNAATATKLAATVNIGGVSFDGSAAIQLPGVDIAGTVDTSGKAGSIANASDTTTSTDQKIAFIIGNNVKTNTNLTINPSTAELKATKFTAGTGGFVDSTFTNKGVIYYDSTSGKLVSTALGTVGQVIKADTNGVPVWGTDSGGVGGSGYWTQPSGTTIIHYNTGNVGINTSTPQYKLDVNGDIRTTSEGGFRGNGGNITGINITSERNQTIINFGQQSSLKVSANGDPD